MDEIRPSSLFSL